MKATDFTKPVYTVLEDIKGFYYIEENTLADRVRQSAEETTSPRGVESKLHLVGCELRLWEHTGKSVLVSSFESEEEALQEWLERTYEFDYLNSDYYYADCEDKESAIEEISFRMELDIDCVESILKHYEQLRQGMAKKQANYLMSKYYQAKEDSKGCETKSLSRAIYNAKFPSSYMWGGNLPYDGPSLPVEEYYTSEFKNEIGLK